MLKMAIVSDLHCHSSKAPYSHSFLTCELPKVPASSHPVEALKKLVVSAGLSADVLLCPGDFADRCSTSGMATAWEAVNEIAVSLGAERIIGTVGNHDVDSQALYGDQPFAPAQLLGSAFPVGDSTNNTSYWDNGFCLIQSERYNILVLNSMKGHESQENAARGSVSAATLESIERCLGEMAEGPLSLAVVHHHPHLHENTDLTDEDVMQGGQTFLQLLSDHGFTAVIHGHKHQPRLSYAAGSSTSPVVFAVGSLSHIHTGPLATITRNLFHVVEIERASYSGCTVQGTVKSWSFGVGRGWQPAAIISSEFPHVAGFGCRSFPVDLASQIAPHVGSLSDWSQVEAVLPQIRYVLPRDRTKVFELLKTSHAIRVLFDEHGEPAALTSDTANE